MRGSAVVKFANLSYRKYEIVCHPALPWLGRLLELERTSVCAHSGVDQTLGH